MRHQIHNWTTFFLIAFCFCTTQTMAQDWNDGNGGTALTTTKRVFTSSNPSTANLLTDRRMGITTSTDRFGMFIENSTPEGFVLPILSENMCLEYYGEDYEGLLFGIYVKMPYSFGYAGYFEGNLGACGDFVLHNPNGNGGVESSMTYSQTADGMKLKGGSASSYVFTSHSPNEGSAFRQIRVPNSTISAISIGYGNGSQYDKGFLVNGKGKIETWGGAVLYNNSAGAHPLKIQEYGGIDKFYVHANGGIWSNKGLSIESTTNDNSIEVSQGGTSEFKVTGNGLVYTRKGFEVSAEGNDGEDAFAIKSGDIKNFSVKKTGHLFATEIRVTQDGIPDYVFKEDYDLMPLEEVEAYVKEHKHLPNIPSEKEILTDGLNLGDQQMNQLEKIEELTLYIIEMNKRLNKIENENESLKSELNSLSSDKKE